MYAINKSKWFDYGLPCPCGKSSDAYAIDKEGDGYCFSCKDYFKNKDEGEDLTEPVMPEGEVEFKYHPHRNISRKVYEFYDVKTKLIGDKLAETGFQYPDLGVKIRNHLAENKKYKWNTKGEMSSPGLFGKHLFDPGSKESITISEGMYDALAVYEMTRAKTASVAVTSASSAARDCKKDWDYINSFKKIYLCFDNDEAGKEALRAVTPMFDFNKVYHVKLTRFKDPTEYIENSASSDFHELWENSRRFVPENIISSFSEIKNALKQDRESSIAEWPFKRLQEATYGLHEGEVVVIKGGSGIGKTEIMRALEHHVLSTTKHNLGIIHLEEDAADTIKAIAGYELHVNAQLPDCGLSDDDIFNGYKKAVGDSEDRVFIYNTFETEQEQVFLDNVRFLATACNCKVITFDHITWLATGNDEEDERRKLDRLSQKLKLLAKELRIALVMISHTNDNGQTRGSRNIKNVANTMIHVDRDLMNSDPSIKNRLDLMLEKVRLGGATGPAGFGMFDRTTGRLEDGDTQLEMEFKL